MQWAAEIIYEHVFALVDGDITLNIEGFTVDFCSNEETSQTTADFFFFKKGKNSDRMTQQEHGNSKSNASLLWGLICMQISDWNQLISMESLISGLLRASTF